MPEIIKTIEELRKFINDKGMLEIAVRGQNQRFKQFQKVILQDTSQSEVKNQIEKALHILNQNKQLGDQVLKKANKLENMSQLQIFLSVLNLGVTCAGFAIMLKELTGISGKIDAVLSTVKAGHGMQLNFEFGKILSEHSNMLDKRSMQSDYSEDKMHDLVSDEYNVLKLLIEAFLKDATDEREKLVFSIYSLASMLASSIMYYDEVFYFNHKERIENGKGWHLSHDNWVSVFDEMLMPEFISGIQDFGFFELGLSTNENDYYYTSLIDQIIGFKTSIVDNQTLLQAFDDESTYSQYINLSNEETRDTILQAFKEAGVTMESSEVSDVVNDVFEKIAIA